jgi:hypothetical protein
MLSRSQPIALTEEIPMTMQIAMRAKDGIILASDTRSMEDPELRENEFWNGGRYGPNVRKIKISHEKGIAISGAWDMKTAGYIAGKIISDLTDEMSTPDGIENVIERIGANVPVTERRRAQCIIVLTRPILQILWLQVAIRGGEWKVDCRKFTDLAIAGDNTNAAIFWAERYYSQCRWIRKPMKRLVPLAAHMISSAHYLNTAGIGGLEIALCGPTGIRRLSNKSIEALEDKAAKWDSAIGNLFLNYQQRFTYEKKAEA